MQKEEITLEKIYNAIEDLKKSGYKQYMRNRYRASGVFGISITAFALGLLTASISKEPQIAIASGFLIGGILVTVISILLLTRAQKDNYTPSDKP